MRVLVWGPLVEFAKEHDFARIKIDLNLAWLHEGYHANWSAVRLPERSKQLLLKVPLFSFPKGSDKQICIGRLEFVARGDDPDVYHRVAELTRLLRELDPMIDHVVQTLELRDAMTEIEDLHGARDRGILKSGEGIRSVDSNVGAGVNFSADENASDAIDADRPAVRTSAPGGRYPRGPWRRLPGSVSGQTKANDAGGPRLG